MFKRTEVLRFETELSEELENVKRLAGIIEARLKKLPPPSDDEYDVYIDSIAHNLEGFYMGVEELFKMVCTATEEGIPEGERWHSILLRNMTKEIGDLRPPVISEKTGAFLDDYRKFRHLARNIYTFRIIPEKVLVLAKAVGKTAGGLEKDISKFLGFLFDVAQ